MTPHSQSLAVRARHRGFTLIELLTVVAIVGILAAILIPVIGRAKDTARTAACASNLRQISAASILWSNDNKNYLVPIATGAAVNGSDAVTWRTLLEPYLGTPTLTSAYACPAMTFSQTVTAASLAKGLWPADYGINKYDQLHEYITSVLTSAKTSAVKHPGNCIEFCDIGSPDSTGGSPYNWTQNKRPAQATNYGYAQFPPSWGDWTIWPEHAEGHRVNVAFYDGHVASVDIVTDIANHPSGDPLCLFDNH